MENKRTPVALSQNATLGADDEDALFADFPRLTPGRITYRALLAIVEWRERHGLDGGVSKDTVLGYQEEGQTASVAGLELGLIDYGQATGYDD